MLLACIGTAYYDPDNPQSLEELLVKADSNMYEQKNRETRPSRTIPTRFPSTPGISSDLHTEGLAYCRVSGFIAVGVNWSSPDELLACRVISGSVPRFLLLVLASTTSRDHSDCNNLFIHDQYFFKFIAMWAGIYAILLFSSQWLMDTCRMISMRGPGYMPSHKRDDKSNASIMLPAGARCEMGLLCPRAAFRGLKHRLDNAQIIEKADCAVDHEHYDEKPE